MFERFRTARERPPTPAPLAALPRPLAECRLALVVSSVCLAPRGRGVGRSVPLGDPSLREVAADFASTGTRAAADASAANLDRNLAFALDRLREAVAAGRLGELNRRHLALGGAMAATGRAIARRVPQVADRLIADGVDAALLVPT
jgi:D-proline reductase (dithiol) PrdB